MFIALRQAEYYLQLSAMGNAGTCVRGAAEQPEMTGKMPSLENYLESYSKISDLLQRYGALLQSDAVQMKSAASAIVTAEQNLLK